MVSPRWQEQAQQLPRPPVTPDHTTGAGRRSHCPDRRPNKPASRPKPLTVPVRESCRLHPECETGPQPSGFEGTGVGAALPSIPACGAGAGGSDCVATDGSSSLCGRDLETTAATRMASRLGRSRPPEPCSTAKLQPRPRGRGDGRLRRSCPSAVKSPREALGHGAPSREARGGRASRGCGPQRGPPGAVRLVPTLSLSPRPASRLGPQGLRGVHAALPRPSTQARLRKLERIPVASRLGIPRPRFTSCVHVVKRCAPSP